jgi:hypothetical protein
VQRFSRHKKIIVEALLARQFAGVPPHRDPDSITWKARRARLTRAGRPCHSRRSPFGSGPGSPWGSRCFSRHKKIIVEALLARQFAGVPPHRDPDSITLRDLVVARQRFAAIDPDLRDGAGEHAVGAVDRHAAGRPRRTIRGSPTASARVPTRCAPSGQT